MIRNVAEIYRFGNETRERERERERGTTRCFRNMFDVLRFDTHTYLRHALIYAFEHIQIVLAWIGTMFGLYGVSKLFGGSDKPVAKEEPARVAAAPSSSGESEIPSAFSKSFEEWSKIPGNMKKWEESCKDFDAWMKVPGNKAKYEASLSA